MPVAEFPLIVRPPAELWLAADHPAAETARHDLARFADLVKTPNPYSVYRLSRYSIWNAQAAGWTAGRIAAAIAAWSGRPAPPELCVAIDRIAARSGRFRLVGSPDGIVLEAADPALLARLRTRAALRPILGAPLDDRRVAIDLARRGAVKLALGRIGYPVADRAGFAPAEPLSIRLAGGTPADPFALLRPYQRAALDAFLDGPAAGSGIVVLPCGAGKTLVGIAAIAAVQAATLVITPGIEVARQWIAAIGAQTDLPDGQIGEYSGDRKAIRPVTVATYPSVARRLADGVDVFGAREWGLVIYDEVHGLPAPVFRSTAGVQARRRLGLTATLVREDGRAGDVFALIGPKCYDAAWPELTAAGWIAPVECVEVRVPRPASEIGGPDPDGRRRARIAATNPAKVAAVRRILADHPNSTALIIGQYLDQLRDLAARLEAPIVTGQTDAATRSATFAAVRSGALRRLVLSRVGNQAIDLPAADLAIEVSGVYGSRQEEAQRLGRVLRPKGGRTAHFYTIVSAGTVEEGYAERRQRFLLERGYRFRIERWAEAGGTG